MARPALLGVDVGFSEQRKTTGLAWFSDGVVQTAITRSSWSERERDLPAGITFRLAALDAPIVPDRGASRRGCEYIFYGSAFARRCRPGLSHYGRGLGLRNAGARAAKEFAAVLVRDALPNGPSVFDRLPIIEAFPNTFMGLLLPEGRFLSWSTSLRLAKSDWLYEQLIELGILRRLLDRLLLNDSPIRNVFEQTTNHDKRAALVCLLTAMFAVDGTATIIGDKHGGWFWLPPIDLWANWAQDNLTLALSKHQRGRFPNTARWTAAATEISQ